MGSSNIPTDEEFAKAQAAMQLLDSGLSEASSAILNRFGGVGLHKVFIFYSPANDLFVAYLFFANAQRQAASENSDLLDQMKNSTLDELERAGRGKSSTLKVAFEIDTDENVQREFGGNYYERLR